MQKSGKRRNFLVRRSPLSPQRGILQAGPLRLPCAIGRSSTTIFKREGDGATPIAPMRLLSAYVRSGRLPGLATPLPKTRTTASSGWCDASAHAAYNRPVRLPFPASTESLQRPDRLYDFIVVMDWNVSRRARGLGSAIFLHVAKPGHAPTEGCVALAPRDIARLAPLLSRDGILTVRR